MSAMYGPNETVLSPSPSEVASQKPPVKPSRRRDKPQLSCMTCRQKKLKCDRGKPCSNCSKHGHPESCDYITQDTARARPVRSQVSTRVQDRIRHLEEMVVTLMKNQADSGHDAPSAERSSSATATGSPMQNDGFTHSPAPPPDNQMEPSLRLSGASLGNLKKAKYQEKFVGSDHWEAILEDIADLKVDFEDVDTSEMVDFKPQILFGVNTHATRFEIVSSVPPRPICDALLSCWFNINDMAPLVIHAPSFMKEYDQMWKDPDSTPLMWFGLLFSILGQAGHFFVISGDELQTMPESFTSISEMVTHYRDRTAQCLVEVNYLKPVRYTVEALCLYYLLEFFLAKDSEFGAYVVLGIMVRVAMRLGYHRDASHSPGISPFDGEMRRRSWCMVFQLDLITSGLVGLPRMIREGETDTAEPKNLLDADFDKDIIELPHPRPSTDVTPVAYAIFKTRLLRQLGLIMDQINAINPPSYDDVIRLDSQLKSTHASLPLYLTMRPLSLSLTDRSGLILRRHALEATFQKSRCVLHRKYLFPGLSNPQYRYSRSASVDAAMKLLNIQCILYEASQPGGQLYRERWRLGGGARINQDYVLAGMILCLDLDWNMRFGDSYEDEFEVMWPRDTILQKLKYSCNIWSESSRISALAAKAAEVLRIMLQRLETGNLKTTQERSPSDPDKLNVTPAPQLYTHNELPRFDDSENFDPLTQYLAGSATTDSVSGMIDTETNFDWELWDSQFQAIPANTMPTGLQDFTSFTFQ